MQKLNVTDRQTDRQTDGRTDRQTDGGRCNISRPGPSEPREIKIWGPGGGGGGGGGCVDFFRKTILSHFTFYAIFNIKKNIDKCLFTYWLNGRWFLQIVERDSWNLYIHYILYSLVLILYLKCGGGGVMFFSHFMLFPTFLEKKIWEYKTILFVYWKYCKVPIHLQLLVKWEVVSPNSRYREFYHEIGNIEKCPFTYWLNGGDGFSKL